MFWLGLLPSLTSFPLFSWVPAWLRAVKLRQYQEPACQGLEGAYHARIRGKMWGLSASVPGSLGSGCDETWAAKYGYKKSAENELQIAVLLCL